LRHPQTPLQHPAAQQRLIDADLLHVVLVLVLMLTTAIGALRGF